MNNFEIMDTVQLIQTLVPQRLMMAYGSVMKQTGVTLSFNMKAPAFDGFDIDGVSGMYEDRVIYINITQDHVRKLVEHQMKGSKTDTVLSVLEFISCIFCHEFGHSLDPDADKYDMMASKAGGDAEVVANLYCISEERAYRFGLPYVPTHLMNRYINLNERNLAQYERKLVTAREGGVFCAMIYLHEKQMEKAYDKALPQATPRDDSSTYEHLNSWANEAWLQIDNDEKERIRRLLEEAGLSD